MPTPEYVVCCGLKFLSKNGEQYLREQIAQQQAALKKIAEDQSLNDHERQEIAVEVLQAQKPYPAQ